MSWYKTDDTGEVIRKKSIIDCQKAIEEGREKILVEQSHKDEVDINNIVARHGADNVAAISQLQNWAFDDVVGNDFQESMNAIIKARDTFEQVPSRIRKEFDNDPAKFLDFVRNPDNQEQLYDWGLAQRPPVVEPILVEMATPPPETTTETPPA